MVSKLLERSLAGTLLVIAAGMVIHTPVTLWLGLQMPGYELIVKSWKELLMGVALVLLIIIAARQAVVTRILADRVIQLSLVFAGIHFLMISVFQNGLDTAGAGLLIDLRFVLYFVLVYTFITLLPQYRRLFIIVMTGGAAIIIGFAILQLTVLPKDILASIGYSKATISPYLTVDENPDYIRINSTMRGPNPLGAYAVVVISLLAAVAVRWRLERRAWILGGLFALATLATLNATYSRSALAAAIVAVILIGFVAASTKIKKQLALGVSIVAVIVCITLFAFRDSAFVSNVILHDSPTTGAAVDSNSGHADSLADGFDKMLRQPLGAGVGSTGSASLIGDEPVIIENQYLFIAHEAGWAGLAVYVWLFVEIMRRLWARRVSALALGVLASGIGLAIIGLLLPVWTDDTVSIIWWGLAAIAVAGHTTGVVKRKARKNHGA